MCSVADKYEGAGLDPLARREISIRFFYVSSHKQAVQLNPPYFIVSGFVPLFCPHRNFAFP